MPDTRHWIVVRHDIAPYEIETDDLVGSFSRVSHATHLVPGTVWRDYTATAAKLQRIREEMKLYNMPELTAVASKRPPVAGAVEPPDAPAEVVE